MLSEPEHNWEERREQLSALLDNELAGAERAQLQTHLQSCSACRAELESLRRTRALLRALPQPALPRSFLLPLEPAAQQSSGELAEPARAGRKPSATPAPSRSVRSAPISLSDARSNRLRRSTQVVRWLSTIAAVLGLFLLLSSAFSTLSLGKSTAANTSSSQGAYAANTPTQDEGTGLGTIPPTQSTQKATNTTQDRATPTEVGPNPAATPTAKGNETAGSATPGATQEDHSVTGSGSGFSLSTPELGLILLGVGVIGFVVATLLRRLWSSASR